jgi:hypothetical protein
MLQCRLFSISHALITQTVKEYESCRYALRLLTNTCTYFSIADCTASRNDRNWKSYPSCERLVVACNESKVHAEDTSQIPERTELGKAAAILFAFYCASDKWNSRQLKCDAIEMFFGENPISFLALASWFKRWHVWLVFGRYPVPIPAGTAIVVTEIFSWFLPVPLKQECSSSGQICKCYTLR